MAAMETKCLRCGAALSAGSIEGFCQRCLATVAFDTTVQAAAGSIEAVPVRRLGAYELIEEIGRGGMGVVYRARQLGLDREVAVKVLRQGPFADAGEVARFRREAAAAAGLRHPNVVAVHEVGEADGHTFFSMDLVRGPTLAELVRDGPMEPIRAARYTRAIAEAVAAAHAQGILHRDLKPSNVIIDDDGPHVTDFGLAKRLEVAQATPTQEVAGSPGYMPPEQADPQRGSVSVAADVYSAGALLYHLLTGRPPFQGETLGAILVQVQSSEPVAPRLLNPSLPRDLETICLKCLEKEPSRRYTTARELADELGRFLRNVPILGRPVGSVERFARWCRRRPAVAALSASVALLLVALAGGASVAAWRINLARRAEHGEREKALQANTHLSETVAFLELQRAEAFFRSGDGSVGLAHLAGVLRRDPSNHVAAERILSALLHRNWVLPIGPALQHPHFVRSVAFSPSGYYVVSGCADGFARIWDVRTRQETGIRLGHPSDVRSACFSPDESEIATACADGGVRIWKWRTAELAIGPMKHDGWVFSVSFSPDGERVVAASGDRTARVWSARTGERLLTLTGHTDEVWHAVFSPDGLLIATASQDGSARLWDSRTGEPIGSSFRHGGGWVLGAAFSPDGGRLATASRDRTAIVWNVETGAPVLPPIRQPEGLNDIQFDPTGRILVTTAFDNTIRLWDAQTAELLCQPFRHREQANHSAFSPDGRTLATAADDWTIKFWEVHPGETLKEPLRRASPAGGTKRGVASDAVPEGLRHVSPVGGVKWVEFSRDGRWIATASYDNAAQVWDGHTCLPVSERLEHGAPVQNACFSPDGRFVVTASADSSAWIWDARTGNRTKGPFVHAAGLWTASFSPDGRRLVTASADRTARVWDIDSKQPITRPLQHNGEVFVARFSPDGTRLVTASADNTARVWNAENGDPITKSLPHRDKVRDAHFSPDGLRVATASMDNTARIWDARSGQQVGSTLHHLRTVETIAFSPDGLRLVTASLDHTARVWDAVTGEPLTPPLEHDEEVWHACFSPDGQRVLTASMDRTARIWDAKTGLPLSDPLRHKGPVRMAQFSPDGERVVTGTLAPDNAARIWQVPVAPAQVPDWLPALAEAVAGLAVGAEGTTRLVPENEFDQLRQRLNDLTDNDTFTRVARWFFANRATRRISPFQSETVAEYVQRRIAENTLSSLEEAVRLDPTNGLALARLAKCVLPTDPANEPRRTSEAAHLAKRALGFSPELSEAREVLQRVSRQAGRTDGSTD